jgi:hypothetical protein
MANIILLTKVSDAGSGSFCGFVSRRDLFLMKQDPTSTGSAMGFNKVAANKFHQYNLLLAMKLAFQQSQKAKLSSALLGMTS